MTIYLKTHYASLDNLLAAKESVSATEKLYHQALSYVTRLHFDGDQALFLFRVSYLPPTKLGDG